MSIVFRPIEIQAVPNSAVSLKGIEFARRRQPTAVVDVYLMNDDDVK